VGITGALLVGGASSRFGSPKALAELAGETLAERGWRILDEACDERIAVGKAADCLELPFPIVDDGSPVRAPLAGVVAAIRAATHDVCVVLPVDCPLVTPALLRRLADECRDAAAPTTGPLPGAYRRSALPLLERRLHERRLALHEALAELAVARIAADPDTVMNVNTPEDFERARVLVRTRPSVERPL
jgi:molybdopterin-guanine dinucleotide biosynthesis protein A